MRILVIGGTVFVGRHIVAAAIDAGHEVTLFHRGAGGSGADLFPQATHVHGDRDGDLAELSGGSWDATVDVCAYVPAQVRRLARALGGRGGQHLFISTISTYRTPVAANFTEDAPLIELADPTTDPTTEQVTDETYGGLKVLCERAAAQEYGADLTVVRPTYVIGPYDHTGRFTYWVNRIARGGEVLAPGAPDDPIQVIDARDQASWIEGLLRLGVTGTFHAASPPPPYGFGDLLDAIAAEVAPPGTTLTWVDSDLLHSAGEDDRSLPLWPGADSESDASRANPAAAYATGLAPRPIRVSVQEIHDHERQHPTAVRRAVGLTPEREAHLLAEVDR